MKKIWARKVNSFDEAKRFDKQYYSSMSKADRLGTIQFLREQYLIIKNEARNEGRKRLRRIITVVQ